MTLIYGAIPIGWVLGWHFHCCGPWPALPFQQTGQWVSSGVFQDKKGRIGRHVFQEEDRRKMGWKRKRVV